ncbi:hypothetical protein IQ07DRAFT_600372 [Pyrenochaeta sp. DS3sAY3a]|nr:hypothetical protein IQ07DRAFT_600372 [Pyrenochaeta sp. DS3sAY3a]
MCTACVELVDAIKDCLYPDEDTKQTMKNQEAASPEMGYYSVKASDKPTQPKFDSSVVAIELPVSVNNPLSSRHRSHLQPAAATWQSLSQVERFSGIPNSEMSLLMANMPTSSTTRDCEPQQVLFEMIRRDISAENILTGFERYKKLKRPLSWFQDVEPGLIPGVEREHTPWLGVIRAAMWSPALYAEHAEICKQQFALENLELIDLHVNDHGLRKQWPVVIESLRPLSSDMIAAVDRVSRALVRRDCLQPKIDQEAISDPTMCNHPSFDFVVVRQAIQDKILSPLIDELSLELVASESQMEYSSSKLSVSQTRHDLQSEQRHRELILALQTLRTIIISEKDRHDGVSTRKRAASTHEERAGVDSWKKHKVQQ